MERHDTVDQSNYFWDLAEQRSRADDDRATLVRAFFSCMGRRLRSSAAVGTDDHPASL